MRLDGELLFDKRERGRFPLPGEVEEAIAARLAPGGAQPKGAS